MSQYRIIHKETLVGWFYVDANDDDEALENYKHLVDNGEIDFGDLEMVDSSDTAILVES